MCAVTIKGKVPQVLIDTFISCYKLIDTLSLVAINSGKTRKETKPITWS